MVVCIENVDLKRTDEFHTITFAHFGGIHDMVDIRCTALIGSDSWKIGWYIQVPSMDHNNAWN